MCAAQARQSPPPPPTPPHKGRAIACGNFGFESCVRERGWIPKLRARPDFDSDVAPVRRKLATCDCPAHKGGGNTPRLPLDGIQSKHALIQPGVIRNVPAPDDPSLPDRLRPHTSLAEIRVAARRDHAHR